MRFTSWGVVRILLQQAKACTMLASTGWGLPTSDSTSTSTSPGIWSPSAPIELLLQHGEPPSTLDGGSILAIPISGYLILPNLPPFPTLATRSADLRENNCLPAHQILTPCPPSSFECFTNLAATVQERALTIQPCCSDWAHSARPHALACGALQKWLVWANDRGMQIRCWRRVLQSSWWGADHTSRYWHNLFLYLNPSNFMAVMGHASWVLVGSRQKESSGTSGSEEKGCNGEGAGWDFLLCWHDCREAA